MGEDGVYKLAWVALAQRGGSGEKSGGVGGGECDQEREIGRGFHGCYWEG